LWSAEIDRKNDAFFTQKANRKYQRLRPAFLSDIDTRLKLTTSQLMLV
jgi:hypothetical protein